MKRRILCFVLTMAMVLSVLVVVPAVTVSADTTVNVGTRAELEAVATAVNAGTDDYSGKTVVLTADIDLSGSNWTSIGNSSNPFRGSFNGNGHVISNMTRSGGAIGQNVGLFGVVSSPDGGSTTIQNFKITGSIVSNAGGDNAGMVVSAVKPSTTGTVTVNITGVWSAVNFDAGSAKMTGVGGILGTIAWVTGALQTTINIDSCRYSGTMDSPSAGSNDYGGIFGYPKEACGPRTVNITNCLYDGVMYLRGASPDDNGGIVGYFKGNGGASAETHINIQNCVVAGQFHMPNKTGQTVTGYVVSEASGSGSTGHNVTNVYYCNDSDRSSGGTMGGWYGYYKGGSGSIAGVITYSNVTAKTMTELKAMTSGFADDTKWEFGESTDLPIPKSIYNTFVGIPGPFDDLTQSEFTISSDEDMAEFASLVNGGTTFAGKTIKLGANVALNTTIGITSSKYFCGSFDGQGHTVTITQSLSNPDGLGGLFSMVRIPENSTITIKDVHVTGTITATNTSTGKGYVGGLISAVDAGKSGSGGTINISNVWNTVRINGYNSNAWNTLGGFIAFVRHEDSLKQITINIDSCLWDGVINSGPAIYHAGGFIGYTGNNKADRQPVINITNSVAAGTFMSNIDGYNQQFGVLTGFLKGSFSADASAKVTVNIQNVVSIAKATFSKATGSGSKIGLIEEVDGTTELNLTNIFYTEFARTGVSGDFPVLAAGSATSTSNVVAKSNLQLAELEASAFSDSSKWDTSAGYPCPAGIVSTFGSVPSTLVVDVYDLTDTFEVGTAEALNALATAVNGGKTYEGKTILITADITIESGWTSIGITSSRPFMGDFDGQGHTIEIHQTLSNPDGIGGLIGFVRTPASGTSTIENVHVTGQIDATNSNTGSGYFGGLIGTVDGNTSGSGGTINITNVWNSVYINCGNANMWTGVGGMIGFCRHADGLKSLTVNFDSCLWDGTLNVGPAAYHFGGYVGYTGNNKAGRTLTINIENSVAAGKIALNQTWDQYAGLLVGYLRGGYSSDATAKATVNVNNVVSNGTMTFKTGVACPGSDSKIGHVGRIDDTTNNEVNFTNLYYNAFDRGNLGTPAPALGNGTANTSTNVAAKTVNQMANLTGSAFSNASKWDLTHTGYPCPAGIVTTFGYPDSLALTTYDITEVFNISNETQLRAIATDVNENTAHTYAGKTVRLTADIELTSDWDPIGVRADAGNRYFRGTFDGQGHTVSNVTTAPTSNYTGAFFGYLGDGAVVENLYLDGRITTTTNEAIYYIASVANCVRGTVTLNNVHSGIDIYQSKNGVGLYYTGGLVSFMEHNVSTNLTIQDCEYSGTINCGGYTRNVAGIVAYTGQNNGTKTLTITGTVFSGKIYLNDNGYYYANAGILGYAQKGSGTLTVNITDSSVQGRIYFYSGKAWEKDGTTSGSTAQILGYAPDTSFTLNVSGVTYYESYLYTVANDSSSKTVIGEVGRWGDEDTVWDTYDLAGAEPLQANFAAAEKRNTSDAYKGVRFVATYYNTAQCLNGGTASANFGMYILTAEMYEILGAEDVTTETLDAAATSGVIKVSATKYKDLGTTITVSAVVFNLNTDARKAQTLIAIPYVGGNLGDAGIASYNTVFN